MYVLKSHLPRLYWNNTTGLLDRFDGATVFPTYLAAVAVKNVLVDDDDDFHWTVVTLAEAREKEKQA